MSGWLRRSKSLAATRLGLLKYGRLASVTANSQKHSSATRIASCVPTIVSRSVRRLLRGAATLVSLVPTALILIRPDQGFAVSTADAGRINDCARVVSWPG